METFTIREAAEQCGVTYATLRKRVDRGSVRSVKQDGIRLVPRTELERTGLWPGSEPEAVSSTELEQLRTELAAAHQEMKSLRRLPKQLDAERQARETAECAMYEHRAHRQVAEQAAAAATDELTVLEANLRSAGPIRAWKLARAHRKAADAALAH